MPLRRAAAVMAEVATVEAMAAVITRVAAAMAAVTTHIAVAIVVVATCFAVAIEEGISVVRTLAADDMRQEPRACTDLLSPAAM
jgi:hypothetical protein